MPSPHVTQIPVIIGHADDRPEDSDPARQPVHQSQPEHQSAAKSVVDWAGTSVLPAGTAPRTTLIQVRTESKTITNTETRKNAATAASSRSLNTIRGIAASDGTPGGSVPAACSALNFDA